MTEFNSRLVVEYDDEEALAPIMALVAEHRIALDDLTPGDELTVWDGEEIVANVKRLDLDSIHGTMREAVELADGDSNDDEIAKLQQVAEELALIVGDPDE